MSERERAYITAHYWALLGNSRKEMEAYDLWKRAYPRDWTPWNNAAVLYFEQGNAERALEESLQARERAPDAVLPNSNVARAYQRLGRLDEALAAAEQAKTRGIEVWQQILFDIGYQRGDQALMDQQVAALKDTPAERWTYEWRSAIAAGSGRFNESRELFRSGVEASLRLEDEENAGSMLARAATREALVGNARRARELVDEATGMTQGHWVRVQSAIAWALAGEHERSLDRAL